MPRAAGLGSGTYLGAAPTPDGERHVFFALTGPEAGHEVFRADVRVPSPVIALRSGSRRKYGDADGEEIVDFGGDMAGREFLVEEDHDAVQLRLVHPDDRTVLKTVPMPARWRLWQGNGHRRDGPVDGDGLSPLRDRADPGRTGA